MLSFIPYSMDGFKVVKLEDICHFVDIVITCTGKERLYLIVQCVWVCVCVYVLLLSIVQEASTASQGSI